MNALILGGNGFIGHHLANKLFAKGHMPRILDKSKPCRHKFTAKFDYRCGDFADSAFLEDSLDGIDMVFHLISTTIPATSNENPIFDVQSNIVKTLSLLEQCVKKKVRKIIFTSSGGTVYGVPTQLPAHENIQTNPRCSYGIVKLSIEKYLSLFKLLYGLDYVAIRISNSYGEGASYKNTQGVIPIFLNKIANDELLKVWGDGEVVRDYIYIDDLVNGIYKAATKTTPSSVFNLGNGKGYSLNQIIQVMRQITNRKVEVEYIKKRVLDVSKIYLDISRAKKELLWTPTISLENGIKKVWKFIQNGLSGDV